VGERHRRIRIVGLHIGGVVEDAILQLDGF